MKKVALIVLLLVIVLFFVVWITSDKSLLGHWTSPQDKSEYEEAYNLAMKTMPEPTDTFNIETKFGVVRVYRWSSENTKSKNPIILFPGRSSGAPMWANNLKDFVQQRTIYIIDALGDAGMSIQTSPFKNSDDQALWIDEVLKYLELTKIHAVGHSFGGWSVAYYASKYPKKIASVSLIEPVFTFQSIKPMIIVKSIPYSLKFLPKAWRQDLIKEIASTENIDRSDPVARMIDDAANNYEAKLPVPIQITPVQMRKWSFPVYLALAGKSSIHDSEKAFEVAKTNVKDLTGKVWLQGTHSLPMEYPAQIDREILDFVDRVDGI